MNCIVQVQCEMWWGGGSEGTHMHPLQAGHGYSTLLKARSLVHPLPSGQGLFFQQQTQGQETGVTPETRIRSYLGAFEIATLYLEKIRSLLDVF